MAEWYRDDDERRYRQQADDRSRDYGGRDRQRGMYERGRDEVRSWFGDEDAERRRRFDERQSWRYGRGSDAERSVQSHGTDNYERGNWRTDEFARGDSRRDEFDRSGWRSSAASQRDAGGYGRERNFESRGIDEDTPISWSYTEVWMIPGPYAGHGPRGYQRADERIKDEVCDRLTQHGRIDARDIDVSVSNGEVTLRGSVNGRHAKRQAEDVAESVSGVREVRNELRTSSGALDTDRRAASSAGAFGDPSLEAPLGLGTQTSERQASAASSPSGREGTRGSKATS